MCRICGKTDLFTVKLEDGKLKINEIPVDQPALCAFCSEEK